MLLETVLGLGIFAVCLLMLFSIFPTSHRSTTQAKNVSLATNLARERLEWQLALGHDDAASVPPTVIPKGCRINGEDTQVEFVCTVTVTDVASMPGVRNVVSLVEWKEGPINRRVDLQSYVSKY